APNSPDAYVRDMAIPLAAGGACTTGAPCAYELASALDAPDAACPSGVSAAAPGAPQGLTYAGGGAVVSPRGAPSGDGRRLVFATTGDSDLTSGSDGSTPGVPPPAGQVVVRDLDTGCSTLVSTVRDVATGAMTTLPVPDGGAMQPGGAALSADGTT